ncbi:MAG: outer membrane protein assembly factor BamD [Cyclobacteriaceae bacterium]|jgi:outer membrane protein assembly factor BamD|nr:outer membrane protein assembly factor BamD [Cyclobacteriaceae bacterium]
MQNRILVFIGFLALLFISGCSKFRKIEKSEDWRVKYEAAINYYEKKDYYRSSVLFDQILPIVRGLPEGEKVQFYLGFCQFYDKNYLFAAEYFKTFFTTYGRSASVEEARYMHAYSLYMASPGSNLDQSASIEAMISMQDFLNRYPQTSYLDKAVEVINNIQVKLEKKGFENAKQYYRTRSYKAAITAFDNFKKNFPDSNLHEEADYLVIESIYKLAVQSFQSKQKERYQQVVDRYLEFLDKYPKSKFLNPAEKMYADSIIQLAKLKNVNS